MSDEGSRTPQQNTVSGTQNNVQRDQYNAANQYINSTVYIQAPNVSEPTSSQPPFTNLRTFDQTNFVGRHEEMAWLRQRLAAHHPARFVVIAGIGGVGKTSLAVAMAEQYYRGYSQLPTEERFEAFVWVSAKEKVLTIEGQAPADFPAAILHTLDDIYTAIAQTLEREDITRAATIEQRHQLAQKALRNYRTLLIVDNIESITSSEVREQVRTFLRTLPSPSKAIVTTRERTDWVDNVLKLERLSDADAGQMIDSEVAAQGANISSEQKQQLLELTSGLPLPIKLSIARLASDERFAQVVRWLNDATGDLPEYCVKGQADLVEERSPAAWKLLLAASLFDQGAGASRETLGQIADLDEEERDDALTRLLRLSLLAYTESDRFSMLPIVERYSAARLLGAGFGEQVVELWLEWAVAFATGYSSGVEVSAEQAESFRREYANLLLAFRWCREHERWAQLLILAEGLYTYAQLVGFYAEARDIASTAVAAARTIADEHKEGHFLRLLARVAWLQNYQAATDPYIDRAVAIAQSFGDEIELGLAWCVRVDDLISQNQMQAAETLARDALAIAERRSNLELKVWIANLLSRIESKRKRFDEASNWIDRGEVWARELGWQQSIAWLTYRRGATLIKQNKFTEGEQFLLTSLDMGHSWGGRYLIAFSKQRLAQVYVGTGRFDLARQSAEEAREIYERLGMQAELKEVADIIHQLQSAGQDKATDGGEGKEGAATDI